VQGLAHGALHLLQSLLHRVHRLGLRGNLRLADHLQPAGELVLALVQRLHRLAERADLIGKRGDGAGGAGGGAEAEQQQEHDQREARRRGEDQRIVEGGRQAPHHRRPNSFSISASDNET
jgi:hypothetical protein